MQRGVKLPVVQMIRVQSLRVGRHRMRRLVRENRLRALWRRKFVHTTDSGHALPVSANVLARRCNWPSRNANRHRG